MISRVCVTWAAREGEPGRAYLPMTPVVPAHSGLSPFCCGGGRPNWDRECWLMEAEPWILPTWSKVVCPILVLALGLRVRGQ